MGLVKKMSSLVLFSGGLDSLLAIKILERLDMRPTALIFTSYFFDEKKPVELAERYAIKTLVQDISEKHLQIVKKPYFGYGKNMNPCIDCHLLMLREARSLRKNLGFDLLATGEVLGQRPMSQNKRSLELIEEQSELSGMILRPLSAHVLPETIYEKKGIIERGKLYGISGKGRTAQLALAKSFGITEFSKPGGGCILTDPIFGRRLRQLATANPAYGEEEIAILRSGRVFLVDANLVVIGRNEHDNQELASAYRPGTDIFMRLKDYNGPLLIVKNRPRAILSSQKINLLGETLAWHYPRARQLNKVEISISRPEGDSTISVKPRKQTSVLSVIV